MPLLAPAHGRLTPDVFVLGLPVNPYQPGYPLGEAPLRLLPASIPPPVSSPVSGDVDTTGVHDLSSQGLRDTPSTPARGKATKRRQVLCSPACVTSLPLAAPRVERDAAPRSSPEACLPRFPSLVLPGGCGDVDPDDPVGHFLLSLGRPHTSSPPPRDFLRAAAPEVPELGELVDAGAAAAADTDVFPDPAGIDPQLWEDWFTWDQPLFEGALGWVHSLSAIRQYCWPRLLGTLLHPRHQWTLPRPPWRLLSPRRSIRPELRGQLH